MVTRLSFSRGFLTPGYIDLSSVYDILYSSFSCYFRLLNMPVVTNYPWIERHRDSQRDVLQRDTYNDDHFEDSQ